MILRLYKQGSHKIYFSRVCKSKIFNIKYRKLKHSTNPKYDKTYVCISF